MWMPNWQAVRYTNPGLEITFPSCRLLIYVDPFNATYCMLSKNKRHEYIFYLLLGAPELFCVEISAMISGKLLFPDLLDFQLPCLHAKARSQKVTGTKWFPFAADSEAGSMESR
ncbi:hypothetical protein EUGRSUZ_K00575 [Eucalyptus grandis]|uniref:Uncharacterized protein n=2 Tax=Eucalyptus grandis TaxID=71139 RepID=A0ACC3IQR0_EUCGR|nr:hypothetical protein EUGRSUZ_K00575 [Eucalyptus grandis]